MQMRLFLVLGLVALGRPALPQQVINESDAFAPAFVLRVDPQLASEINEVLAQVAQRTEVVVPAGKTVEEHLIQICGVNPPVYEAMEALDTGATKVRVVPCARIKRDLRIEATAGDTLEGLAVRNGLRRTAASRLKVIQSGDSKARPTEPENLKIGDVVLIPEVPLWTHIVVNPKIVADRAALVSALAARLNCRMEDPEACLAERNVTVLDRAMVREPADPEPTFIQYFREDSRLREEIILIDELQTAAEVISMETSPPAGAASADVTLAPSQPTITLVPASLSNIAPLSMLVAPEPERWPHDIGLLATTDEGKDRSTEDPAFYSIRQQPSITLIPKSLDQAQAIHGLQTAVEVTAVEVMEAPSTAPAGSHTAEPVPSSLPTPPPSVLPAPTSLSNTGPLSILAAPETEQWLHDISLLATTGGGEDRCTESPALCSIRQQPSIVTWTPESLSQAQVIHGLQTAAEVTAVELVEAPSTAPAGSDTAAPVPSLPAPPPSAPPVPTLASATTPLSIPVAPEQWPYDTTLLTAILKDAADAGYIHNSTTIGVADGGLGNLSGNPLPESLFDIGVEKLDDEDLTEPDGNDDDDNQYVDDIFGAGVARIRGRGDLGDGHLGLCETEQPPFATWNPDRLERFSHGAVTSSVAAALGLRKIAPQVTDVLPKLVFFRMLDSACTEDARDKPGAAEMVLAFDYLEKRSNIINISYILDREEIGHGFVGYVREVLPYRDVLLVLPAGNNWPGDLDEHGTCPPCLGNDLTDRGGPAAKRTLVVGAATRDLRRATYSNYGERTVGLFAPGEPMGALDLANQQVPLTKSATSYAAPLAALAAGIIRSFGTHSPKDIKDRLIATTWPLNDPDSRSDRTHVGVLDLVKAAAVRHHAVEVKEVEPDGQLVRRTYVGKLLTPLRVLEFFCDGPAFSEARAHAIRLGEPADDGERQLLVYYRERMDQRTNRRLIQRFSCRPDGELRIRTLIHGEKTFPLSEVTQIQLPWLLQ